jgi:hypothetical protein
MNKVFCHLAGVVSGDVVWVLAGRSSTGGFWDPLVMMAEWLVFALG